MDSDSLVAAAAAFVGIVEIVVDMDSSFQNEEEEAVEAFQNGEEAVAAFRKVVEAEAFLGSTSEGRVELASPYRKHPFGRTESRLPSFDRRTCSLVSGSPFVALLDCKHHMDCNCLATLGGLFVVVPNQARECF